MLESPALESNRLIREAAEKCREQKMRLADEAQRIAYTLGTFTSDDPLVFCKEAFAIVNGFE